jgi:hypothetical protein
MKIPVASAAVATGSLAEAKNERPSTIIFSDQRSASLAGTGFTKGPVQLI